MAIKNFTVRIDEIMLEKLRVTADEDNRSVNRQIIVLIKRYITEYEKQHGEIDIVKADKM